MSIPIFGEIEKLINEHGSAVVLKERLELAKDKYDALEAKYRELEERFKQLDADKSSIELDNFKLKEKIQAIESSQTENNPNRIDVIQEKVLVYLADHPQSRDESLARNLQIGHELCKFHLQELKAIKFVSAQYSIMAPTEWSLGQEGRRYLVSNGLLQ